MSKSSIKMWGRDAEQSRWSQLLDHVCLWTSEGRHEAIYDFLGWIAIQIGSIWFTGIAMH